MAGSINGSYAGGILGLYGLIQEHREAIRYDLFMIGRSLDDLGSSYSWADFAAFVRFAPPQSQLATAIAGFEPWSRAEVLLATVIDTLRGANWQRAGGKGQRPKPIEIPGYGKTDKKFGKATDVETVRSYLEARNGRAPEVR